MNVVQSLDAFSAYRDSRSNASYAEQQEGLQKSSTVYVGNLSFYTTEEQIYELFSKTGNIKRIIMGLDRNQKTPCGFCFVEYYTREDALESLRYISGTKLDERFIRADLDPGYKDGRQYGRGRSGGQVRDEYREDYDEGRGGWGHLKAERERQKQQEELYQNDLGGRMDIPMGEQDYQDDNPRFRQENEFQEFR